MKRSRTLKWENILKISAKIRPGHPSGLLANKSFRGLTAPYQKQYLEKFHSYIKEALTPLICHTREMVIQNYLSPLLSSYRREILTYETSVGKECTYFTKHVEYSLARNQTFTTSSLLKTYSFCFRRFSTCGSFAKSLSSVCHNVIALWHNNKCIQDSLTGRIFSCCK